MITLTSINSFIEDEEEAIENTNTFDNRDIIPHEISNDNPDHNIETNVNMDFNPENLVDTILNDELDF
ncbi:10860_t:CDS:2 [Racocetra persica]|uniref:10860_t:CDS:1 n=1 Tax=Racocetra persica TaxID=160502 RepID=A0ACA9M9M4_9GLOM|nr:10860_t:CDS:2 [Racocetra persica]